MDSGGGIQIDHRAGELGVVEAGIGAPAREKALMVALLDDLSVLHNQDHVRVTDRRQAMGDHEAGAL